MLEEFLSHDAGRRTQLVLMPSASDATCHPVFPQWPLQPGQHVGPAFFHNADVRRRVSVVPNPSTFVVGGVVVGGTSTDVLFQLNAHDAMRNTPGGAKVEKIPRMASHLLEQRSYYPLFPAPDAADTPLELTQLPAAGMPVSPDVLLLPSKLRQFTKALPSGTLVVNPGMLCRANSGGTFARVAVFPPKRGTLRTRESRRAAVWGGAGGGGGDGWMGGGGWVAGNGWGGGGCGSWQAGAQRTAATACDGLGPSTCARTPPPFTHAQRAALRSPPPLLLQRTCPRRSSRRATWPRASPPATPSTASRSARASRSCGCEGGGLIVPSVGSLEGPPATRPACQTSKRATSPSSPAPAG